MNYEELKKVIGDSQRIYCMLRTLLSSDLFDLKNPDGDVMSKYDATCFWFALRVLDNDLRARLEISDEMHEIFELAAEGISQEIEREPVPAEIN
jgi:hypothetical protein